MIKHFAATVYIVSKIDNEYKVLLHKHKKLGIWIAIGGHVEGDENPYQAAIREAKEETNLDVKIINSEKLITTKAVNQLPTPEVILEETILAYQDQSQHFHIDHIYFAICRNPKKIKMEEEYKWFSKEDLKKAKLGKEVIVIGEKVLSIF